MKRILVLGADEFIGRNVVQALARCGWATPVAASADGRPDAAPGVEHLTLDVADAAAMSRALQRIDAVVNCLSGQPGTIAGAAAALFAAADDLDPAPLIVHISSMSVYGAVEGEITEDAPLRDELGAYAHAKIQAENIAAGYARKVILRPGIEFGPGGEVWSGRVARWLRARRLGDLGSAGDGYCNLVYIDDLVAAVLACLQRPSAVGGVFNLALADPPTWNQYFVQYARALRAVPVRRISRRRLALETKVLAVPLKALELVARKLGAGRSIPPAIPPSLPGVMRQEVRLTSTRARTILDWTCVPLDQALARTAAWYGVRANDPQQLP